LLAAVVCTLILSACSAVAQWELTAFLGAAHTQNSDLALVQPGFGTNLRFRDVHYAGRSFESPLYYGFRGSRFVHQRWGAEIEFIHLKVFSDPRQIVFRQGTLAGTPIAGTAALGSVLQRFSISHGVNLLMANGAFREYIGRGDRSGLRRVMFDVRAGAGVTIPHAESEVLGHVDEHYQVGRPVIQLAAGAQLRLWRRLYGLGEYKFTRVHERVDVFSGTAETLLLSHHLVTGVAVHF
jgi:hypothetical protein